MKFSLFGILALLLLTHINCTPKNDNSAVEQVKEKTVKEVITRSYDVKMNDSKPVKDKVNMIQSITYHPDGREAANLFYNLDGSLSWKDEYLYNKGGQKIGSSYYGFGNNKVTANYIYDLDAFGRKVGFRVFDFDTDTIQYDGASQFENDGKLRKDGGMKDGEFVWNYEYTFDDTGKETGYTYIDLSNGERSRTTYKYTNYNKDAKWIQRHIIENGKVIGIESREFKY